MVRASGRQGVAASSDDLRNVLTQQRNTRGAWGNNDTRARANGDMATLLRSVQSMLDKSVKDNVDMKQAMEALARQVNLEGSS